MKPFHSIAIPHNDILQGKFTMNVFAADIWETHLGRTVPEYRDSKLFFKQTYMTAGLKNLVDVVEKRLKGAGGDPVIQIQTPFGGGKTHALITLYHNAKNWNVRRVILSGTALSSAETLWGSMEEQLSGKIDKLGGSVSPGREALRELLEENQPVLILIDELLEYTTKAAAVTIKDTSLAAQTLAFMQELTEAAAILETVCLIITLPSSVLEQYDRNAEKMFNQLQKVSGRVEKVYSPVQENEIARVIRHRLFSHLELSQAEENIVEILHYMQKEGIIPIGTEVSEYKERFLDSYPFMPEVVDTLYHRWGSIPTFQRTRGVLRLLSLIINSLKDSKNTYISLADFDLGNDEIRRELVKFIGNEFDSVVSADITNENSGSKKVDESLGKSFRGLKIGTRSATSIFMYSFSGGIERGCHLGDVIRSSTTTDNPSSIVAEAVDQLKSNLFFLQSINEKYLFSNHPNLNRIILTKIENIQEKNVVELEKELLKRLVTARLKVYLWPEAPKDIPDTPDLKLIVLREKDDKLMRNIVDVKGESPRIYRNTIFYLIPLETERAPFLDSIKRRLAYEQIDADKTLSLTDEQRDDVKNALKKDQELLGDGVRRLYRTVYVPDKDGFKEFDLGIPTYGDDTSIDKDVYNKLKSEEEILENLSPIVIQERYLEDNEHIEFHQIYDSMVRTPGETRVISRDIIEAAVKSGIRQGKFGLGRMDNQGNVICTFFQQEVTISIDENDLVVSDRLCNSQTNDGTPKAEHASEQEIEGVSFPVSTYPETETKTIKDLTLRFTVPLGKISQIYGTMNFLQSKFQSLEIEIKATNGNITEDDLINKIIEGLQQLGIDVKYQ
jgi:hypothetical protein